MKGYIYKEIRQNRMFLIFTVILSVCVAFLPLILVMTEQKTITKEAFLVFAQSGVIIRIICSMLGFLGAFAIQSLTLMGDDKKMWGYFVASNPKGIKGFVFTKYGFIFALGVIYLALCAVCDLVLVIITRFIGGAVVPYMAELYLELFFCQLLWCALDIPFTIRFGEKKGSYIKMAIFAVLAIIFILVFFFNPAGLAELISNFFLSGEIPTAMKWILPVGSLAAYIFSALISSKLYLKGVERHYK